MAIIRSPILMRGQVASPGTCTSKPICISRIAKLSAIRPERPLPVTNSRGAFSIICTMPSAADSSIASTSRRMPSRRVRSTSNTSVFFSSLIVPSSLPVPSG